MIRFNKNLECFILCKMLLLPLKDQAFDNISKRCMLHGILNLIKLI